MAEKSRYPYVDRELCIGCSACSSICDTDIIKIVRNDFTRIIRFRSGCPENCDKCLNSCPVGALSIKETYIGESYLLDISFDMCSCRECGRYFATNKMIEHVKSKIAMDEEWLNTCVSCRQQTVARTMRSIHYGS